MDGARVKEHVQFIAGMMAWKKMRLNRKSGGESMRSCSTMRDCTGAWREDREDNPCGMMRGKKMTKW